MLFVDLQFLPFFALVFGVHWALRSARLRKAWLLLASYAFYAAWDWRFLSLIVFSTLVDYAVALRIPRSPRPKRWLLVSLCTNLGLLGFFKYANFFLNSAVRLLEGLGLSPHVPTLEILLPVGISFYTFQTLSYSIDVYRGRLQPERDLLDVALFVGFFPQLVAGPIIRAVDFLPQLKRPVRLARVDLRAAAVLFFVGFVKKAVLSDTIAVYVDTYFAHPANFDAVSAWMGTLLYAVQIYCDFSGYSDMAIACAAVLGYELCVNFDAPYFARNVTDFWRRWHISLSTWLRDYLYIPLGGNRGSRLFTWRNLMLTMLLGGLWHGAGWNFVIWGGLHGLALVVHRVATGRARAGSLPARALALLGLPLTLWFVCLCWIFFRARTFADAWVTLRAYALFEDAGPGSLLGPTTGLGVGLLVGLAALHFASSRGWFEPLWRRLPTPVFVVALAAATAAVLPLMPLSSQPFIYFQF